MQFTRYFESAIISRAGDRILPDLLSHEGRNGKSNLEKKEIKNSEFSEKQRIRLRD